MRRGIILRPTFKGKNTNGGIDDLLLRKIILYWDIIEYPFVNGVSPNYEVLKDMKFLKDCKLIEQSYVLTGENSAKVVDYSKYKSKRHTIKLGDLNNSFMKSFYYSQVELCKYKNSVDKETIWSIGDLNDDLSHIFFDKNNRESVAMEFYNFLPHPNLNTKINDILEFKNKRKDELLYLRSNIDDLSSIVYKSENIETELKKNKEQIEKSLLDLHRTFDETKIQKICSNLNIYLNLDKSEILKFIANSTFVGLLTQSPFLSLASYGIQVLLKVGQKKVSKMNKIPDRLKNYLYVYNVEQKFK